MRLPLTLKNFERVRHSSREVRRGRVRTSISSLIFVTVIFSLSKDVACVSSDPNHGSLQTYYGLLSSVSVLPLVISLSVIINPQSSWARNIKNGQEQPSSSPRIFPSILGISLFQKSLEEAAAKEETKPKESRKRKKLPARFARQLSILAPALQTMGCLPKFFCGMNSKAPSETTSTLNDMAYLIRFAMVDDDSEESSGENRGKDGMSSDEGSREKTSQERREDQRFEYQAEEELVMDDPEYLSYMWKDMKEKLRNKFKDGKIDDEVFEQMIADWDKENKGSFQLPTSLLSGIGSIGSGIKSLVRFGRSVSSDESSSSSSRRGRAFWDTKEFDQQMTLAARIGKTSGNDDKKCTTTFNLCPYSMEQMKGMVSGKVPQTNGYENFYDNTKGPPRPTGKDSKEDEDEPVSVKPKPFKFVKKPNNKLAQAVYQINPDSAWGRRPPSPKRPHSSIASTTLASILRPLKQSEAEDDEVAYDNHALDYAAETKLIKLSEVMNLPKKTAYKPKKNKKKPSKAKDDTELDSSEEEKDSKPLKKKRPLIPVGIPRPKYKVNKNKIIDLPTKKKPTKPIKVRDEEEEEEEEDEEPSQEDEEESGEKRNPQKKRKKPAGSPEQSGESEEKEEDKKSSEEANSSEEGGRRKNNGGGRRPGNKEGGGGGGGWEEYEFSGEVTPGPHVSLRPISYSYFKNKPPPTSALPPSPDGPEDEESYSSAPPPPPASQNPGFFSSLFGMGKKRPQQQPQPSQMPPQEIQYEEMVRDEDEADEEDSRSQEQEDYHSNIHGRPEGPPSPPPFSPEPSEGPPRPHQPTPSEGPQGSQGPQNHRPPPNNQNRPSSQLSQYNRRPPPPQNRRPRPPQNSRPPPTQNSRPPPQQNSRPPPPQNSRPNRPHNSRPGPPQNSRETNRPPPPPDHRNPSNGPPSPNAPQNRPPHSHSDYPDHNGGRPDHRPHFSNEILNNRPLFSNEVSHNRPPPKHSNHPSNRPLPPPPSQHNSGPHFLPPFRPGHPQNDDFDDRRPSPGIPPPATPGHPDHPDSRIPDDDDDFRPPPQERRESPSSNSQPNQKSNNNKDSDEESKEEEEEEDLTSVSEESKESEEVAKDKIRVKEIFSKGSIASLGSDKVTSTLDEVQPQEYIPPPPPIAHWKPPEISTTKPVANPTQTASKQIVSNSKKPSPSSLEIESVEVHVLSSDEDDSKENKESDEEKSSEEERRKNQVYLPEGGSFKPEDDEADNPEPPKENLNDVRVAELGNVVKTPPVTNVGSDYSPNYYPPLAPASAFLDPKKEIKIPLTKPSVETPVCVPTRRKPCPKQSSTKLGENGGENKNPAEGTKNGPGGIPGGGLPGNVPGTGALNRAPGGGRPGGGTNNRGQSGGNSNNGNGGNGNGNEDSTNENNSSEEEIGEKSSEESENETEEEEEDYDEEENSKRGRKASTKIKLKLKKPSPKLGAKTQITKANSTVIPPTTTASETPQKKSELEKLGVPKAPPLPPVFRWGNHPVVSYPKRNNKPRLTSPVSTKKPVIRRFVRPRPTKDSFYSKPLSPKLVQYLRETYGGVVKIPDRVRDIKSPPTTTSAPKKASRKEVERSTKKPMKYSWRHSFEDEDEISQVGKKSSEEIDFDEMKHENDGVGFKITMLGKRQGEPETDKKSSKTSKDVIAETTLPPIYGQNHFKKG